MRKSDPSIPVVRGVIAGLDPAIHPSFAKSVLAKKMDPRVKPAGDVL
jgi:hypothetical protein